MRHYPMNKILGTVVLTKLVGPAKLLSLIK